MKKWLRKSIPQPENIPAPRGAAYLRLKEFQHFPAKGHSKARRQQAALPMAQKISRKYCASSQLQSLFDEFTLAQRKGKIKGPGNCLSGPELCCAKNGTIAGMLPYLVDIGRGISYNLFCIVVFSCGKREQNEPMELHSHGLNRKK